MFLVNRIILFTQNIEFVIFLGSRISPPKPNSMEAMITFLKYTFSYRIILFLLMFLELSFRDQSS